MERTPVLNLSAIPEIPRRPMTAQEAAAAFANRALLARLALDEARRDRGYPAARERLSADLMEPFG